MAGSVTIQLRQVAGDFAENKDVARDLRVKQIEPALSKQKRVILDFGNVIGTTQSFIHALLSQTMRDHGADVLDSLDFKDCNAEVQGVITIVVDYMQQAD